MTACRASTFPLGQQSVVESEWTLMKVVGNSTRARLLKTTTPRDGVASMIDVLHSIFVSSCTECMHGELSESGKEWLNSKMSGIHLVVACSLSQ